LEDTILEKPATEDHAREMLRRLSGNTHTVHTAVVLLLPKRLHEGEVPHRVVVLVTTRRGEAKSSSIIID
jgi:predicted house-cleaning NTP pyrophosphatase (Maf/HAM1 superfamily)